MKHKAAELKSGLAAVTVASRAPARRHKRPETGVSLTLASPAKASQMGAKATMLRGLPDGVDHRRDAIDSRPNGSVMNVGEI
jgi:hypothetical protein